MIATVHPRRARRGQRVTPSRASMTTAIGFENPVTLFDGTTAAGGFSPEQQNSMLYGICILHTVFNLSTTLILVWFIPQLVKAVNRIIPTPKGEEEVYRLKFIQGGPLSTAELSLDEAKQEIIHFAEICCREVGFIRSAVSAKTHEGYGKEPLGRLNEGVQSVVFSGLDLSALRFPVAEGSMS